MTNFFKGIIAGIGGVAPGLSGSVLLIIFGLYQSVLDSLGSLFKDSKSKLKFLLPIVLGMFTGVLLFSKVINFCLAKYEMPTRFCFLGLIIGTIPLFYQEVKKKGFKNRYYAVIAAAALFGTWMFSVNPEAFKQITDPNLAQCIFLGVAVSATAIVPGLDPAVTLSSLGYYEVYVKSLADFDISVLFPMLIGLSLGAVVISFIMSTLFNRFYTAAFSVIFGVFLSMIPNMLNDSCSLGSNLISAVSLFLMTLGFIISFYLGDFKRNNERIKTFIRKIS